MLNSQILQLLVGAVIVFLSVFWVELVRDCYHALAHVWQPLYRLHVWHHRVFRPDLSVMNEKIYRQAHWYNDVPEATVMLCFSGAFWWGVGSLDLPYGSWIGGAGSLYTLFFLGAAIARGLGLPNADEITDVTHRPGDFLEVPGNWFVNRPYHWRHHFDNQDAYFCGTVTALDKMLGTALSLKGKKVAVTGASGALGKALLKELHQAGAKVTALTSSNQELLLEIQDKNVPIRTLSWQLGQESALQNDLAKIDILILNHGINVHGDRTPEAIHQSYQINTFSHMRWIDLFLDTVKTNEDKVRKEIWVNTSEAEVLPAISPLYELSKRALGDLVNLKRLDAAIVIRKLILGPFKSSLNPIGILSADWVAKQIVASAKRDFRNIIVTINPLTYLFIPAKEFMVHTYFRFFCHTKSKKSE